MKRKETGICIQIGLGFTAEMAYLTENDWRKRVKTQVPEKQIPVSMFSNIKNWKYIGIDKELEYVEKLQEQYPEQTFIHANITDGDSFKSLLEKHGINKRIDVMVIDIEGDEYKFFDTYKSVMPNFLSIECHRWHHSEVQQLNMFARNSLSEFEWKNNLTLHREIITNTACEYPTVELQYINKSKKESIYIDDRLTIHMCGRPHTIATEHFNACAFQMKDLRFDEAMSELGHKVYYYGNEGGNTKGEHIDVVPKEFYEKHYKENLINKNKVYEPHEFSEQALTFNMKMCSEIRMRARPGDIVVLNNGMWADTIVNLLRDIPKIAICEMSVGYGNSIHAPFRVYESHAVQELHKGMRDKVWEYNSEYNEELGTAILRDDAPIDAIHNTRPQFLDDVIPIFLDPRQFNYLDNAKQEKGNYYLYLGRIQWSKGLDIAIKSCEKMGEKLIVAGQCVTTFENEIGYPPPPCVELIGHADVDKRKKLMSEAKGGWVCTYYPEPGGHVAIEYLLSGTPIITTDWGNLPNVNINSITGYVIRSGREGELAIMQINRGDISSYDCRKWAMNFTMDRHSRSYEYYFRRLRDFILRGNGDDLYYEHSDVDLSIRDTIHPKDMRYDIDLNEVSLESEHKQELSKVDKTDGKEVSITSEGKPQLA